MKQVNSFELEVNTKLLERSNTGVIPTEAGKLVCDYLSKADMEWSDVLRRASLLNEMDGSIVRVGTSLLRSCQPLTDRLARIGSKLGIRLEIVPFSDERGSLEDIVKGLGDTMDCFISPCSSNTWLCGCDVSVMGTYKCMIGVPEGHRLFDREKLTWEDLSNERLMLLPKGESKVIDAIRDDIAENHPDIEIIDAHFYYSQQMFNDCAKEGFLMETLESWKNVHPSVATINMDWDYEISYGLIYSKEPKDAITKLVSVLRLDANSPSLPEAPREIA